MRPTKLPLAAALGLSLLACAQQQPTSSPQDLAYCAKLGQIYQRYADANASSPSMAGGTPDVAGGEALAKCREGDAKASIPTLERLLKDADMPLTPAGGLACAAMIEIPQDAPGSVACGRSGLPLLATCPNGHRRMIPFRLLKTGDDDRTPVYGRPFRCKACGSPQVTLFAVES